MRRVAALAVALALAFGAVRTADAQATPELTAGLEAGIRTCIRNFGNVDALRAAFVAGGWKPEPGGKFTRYRAANKGLIAVQSRPGGRESICGVSARGLTMEQADVIIRAALKPLKGFKPHPTEERLWVGTLNGQEVWAGYTIEFPLRLFDAPVIAFAKPFE